MNMMENQGGASGNASKRGWISTLVDLVLSYYANLVSRPLQSGLFYFLGGLVPALVIGWILFPLALYSKQPQPLNFSHAIHASEDIVEGDNELERCLYCHGFRDDGSFVGIPKLENCMACHDDPESPMGEDPEEVRFLTEYVAPEREIPWLSYYRQPDCVYFSHIVHVKMGEQDCRLCHGDHGHSEQLPPYQENRLTGYSRNIWGHNIAGLKFNPWDRMKMDDCAECHTKTGHEENNACFVCHK
jgi:cytochrome c553